jgi:hypothetical protein
MPMSAAGTLVFLVPDMGWNRRLHFYDTNYGHIDILWSAR